MEEMLAGVAQAWHSQLPWPPGAASGASRATPTRRVARDPLRQAQTAGPACSGEQTLLFLLPSVQTSRQCDRTDERGLRQRASTKQLAARVCKYLCHIVFTKTPMMIVVKILQIQDLARGCFAKG